MGASVPLLGGFNSVLLLTRRRNRYTNPTHVDPLVSKSWNLYVRWLDDISGQSSHL
jgi:hypothetical protein